MITTEAAKEAEKALRWLAFQFPKIEKPEDDADRITNCIHTYCENGADTIKELLEQLNMKQED